MLSQSMAAPWAACAVTALVVGLVLARPRGLPEGAAAGIGAALTVVLGLLGVRDALATVAGNWNVLLFFVGLMAVAGLAEEAGVFTAVGRLAQRVASGSPWRLLLALTVAATGITALLSNDATVLLLTPVVIAVARRLEVDPLPYALTTCVMADAASGLLPVANPVNVLVVDGFGISLLDWVRVALLPAVMMAAVSAAVCTGVVRRRLTPFRAVTTASVEEEEDFPALRTATWVLLALGAAYAIAAAVRAPVGPVACAGAGALALVIGRHGAWRLRRLRRDVSWSVLAFVAGLLVVVAGLETTGVTRAAVDGLLRPFAGHADLQPAAALLGAALGSNLVNNLPLSLIAVSGIRGLGGAHTSGLAVAAGLGADVGPNLTPVGSLATLLWLTILRVRGVEVSAATYMALGAVVTVPALVAGAVGVAVTAG